MQPVKPPAPNPCGSCPYRRDVPSGVWDPDEYRKLPAYDRETGDQPPNVFLCHQQDGRACAGWCGVHDMNDSLGLRLAQAMGMVEDPEPFFRYETSTPLFKTGAEAARHGLAEVEDPGDPARATIDKLERRAQRRAERSGDG